MTMNSGLFANTGAILRDMRSRFEASEVCLSTMIKASPDASAPRVNKRLILGNDVALELGKPGMPSAIATLLTHVTQVTDGRVSVVAPVFSAMPEGSALPIGVLAVAGVVSTTSVDFYGLRAALLRIDGLEGVSVRALPGRLWVRVSREACARGVSAADFAEAVYHACRRIGGVEAVEVMLACGDDALVRHLETLSTVAAAQAGEHSLLKWNAGGDLECSSLDCRSCDEESVCSELRQVIKIRGKRRKSHV